MDKMQKDFDRCLPAAQVLFAQLAAAQHPRDFMTLCQDALQDAPAGDLWDAVVLPVRLAEIFIADELSRQMPETEFAYTLDRVFGSQPQQIVSLPVGRICDITGKNPVDVTATLTRLGYHINDGTVTSHDSLEESAARARLSEAAVRELDRKNPPRP